MLEGRKLPKIRLFYVLLTFYRSHNMLIISYLALNENV